MYAGRMIMYAAEINIGGHLPVGQRPVENDLREFRSPANAGCIRNPVHDGRLTVVSVPASASAALP